MSDKNSAGKTEQGTGKKKIRVSILVLIGGLFAVSLFISMAIVYFMSSSYRFENAVSASGQIARDACSVAGIILAYEDPDLTLVEDEEMRDELHAILRAVCSISGLKRIYIYTVDENDVRHHLLVAADTDEEDAEINRVAGFGTTSDAPLSRQEREALNGDSDGYDIISNEYGNVCAWYMPVVDSSSGDVFAIIGADYSMDFIQSVEKKNVRHVTYIFLILVAITFTLALIMVSLNVLKPIRIISERMKNCVHDGNYELPADIMPLEESVENEISDIAGSFQSMGRDINAYIKEIEVLTRKQLENRVQMDVARSIQYGMVLPTYEEEKNGVFCQGFMHAAKDVGGDFYDSFFMGDGKYCGIIGDVSDKGVSAALFMGMTRTMLRDHMNLGISPAEAIIRTNEWLCGHNPEGMFVTIFAFILDPKTGDVLYANSGHNPPLIIGGSHAEFLKLDSGTVTGLLEDMGVKDYSFRLKKGQTLLTYTDGVTDAVNKDEECFGERRIKELFENGDDAGKEGSVVDRLIQAVMDHSVGCEQFDDMTILAVTRR